MSETDTIVALSSGALPSGVAIVRLSGPQSNVVAEIVLGRLPQPRRAILSKITLPGDNEPIDEGIALWFPGPASFTGEDCLELHVHGGRAVVSHLIEGLAGVKGVRLAQPGEFSRRAFLNGRLDLTELEGLADLVAAETEAQRRQAFQQSRGSLRELYESWRTRLVHIRAMIEAELDFSEEEDVPQEIIAKGIAQLDRLVGEINNHLEDRHAGEIIREGYRIVLMGRTNAGKSSLINALAQRNVAIVTDDAGTTRDVLSVDLDIGGYAVMVYDTAGIRPPENRAEEEGVKRAKTLGKSANLVVWLQDIAQGDGFADHGYENAHNIYSKDDAGILGPGKSVSAKTGHGLAALLEFFEAAIKTQVGAEESVVISRARHRSALAACLRDLQAAQELGGGNRELQAERLRSGTDALGKITGRIDVEDLLDVIFSEFCVGK